VVQIINNLHQNQNETILIVDDSRTSQMLFTSLVELHGFKSMIAENGIEALKILNEYPNINIILTDYHMPLMDGFELTAKIRQKFNHYEKGILAITSDYHPLNIALFLKNGANDFIVKPPRKEEFYARLYRIKDSIRFYADLKESQLLLEEHKEAVDERSIVSKADVNGIVTYVNDRFVQMSGYTRDEMLGKNHNIVRHPDMPKEVFTEMWKTIKNKKMWNGVIKNKAKDGSTYIVDATIKPLFDSRGNIKEYIGIRHDLTELFALQAEIIDTQKEIIERLGEVAESRSKETGKHIKRVAEYSALFGELYGLAPEEISLIQMASPMHDIGKIATPDAILLKPGKLDEQEFEIMKLHAQKGYEILKNSNREIFKAAAIIAYQHHERWDGNGYPSQLVGDNIHIYGRITALADVLDALSNKRIYKSAWKLEDTLGYIQQQRGGHFDPDLVDLFINNIDLFLQIREKCTD
jgi:PAS domain S-box-containing protein